MSDVNGRLVLGPTKTYQSRSVPLPRFLCDELVPLLARKGREDLVFPGPEGATTAPKL